MERRPTSDGQERSTAAARIPVLRLCPVFQGLTDTDLAMVAALCAEREFLPGETISAAGTRRPQAYIVIDGSVGVFLADDAEEIPLDHYGPGELVAPMALTGNRPVGSLTSRAMSRVQSLTMDGAAFRALTADYPHIGYEVMSVLVQRISRRLVQSYYLLRNK